MTCKDRGQLFKHAHGDTNSKVRGFFVIKRFILNDKGQAKKVVCAKTQEPYGREYKFSISMMRPYLRKEDNEAPQVQVVDDFTSEPEATKLSVVSQVLKLAVSVLKS